MDTLQPAQRSARMARVRSRDTKPERAVRKLLSEMGHRYRLNRTDVPGKPDIAFVGKKLAIFVHGCFWHRHDCAAGIRMPKSRIAFWAKKFKQNVERDRLVQSQLASSGWRTLVIWECEIKDRSRLRRKVGMFLNAQR